MAKENIDVTVELHDRLSRPAEKAEDSVDDLRESVDGLNESLVENEAAQKASVDATDKSTESTKKSTKETKKSREETKRSVEAQTVLQRVLGKTSTKFRETGKKAKALDVIMKAMKIPAIITAVTLLGQAVGALGAAGFAAIAGLSPLVGTLGAMPSLLATMGQAMAAVKMGFKGIGEAVKVLADPASNAQQTGEALDKLGPAAQQFALQLAGVAKQTGRWKGAIQGAMLPGFAAGLTAVSGQFPVIRRGLVDTGDAMGRLGRRVGVLVGGWTDLDDIMARNNRMIRTGLTPTMLALVGIFHDLLGAGGPMAERFAKWVGASATGLAAMTAEGARTGRLEAFFERAGDLAAAVGGFVGDISAGLFNIGKQSGALSSMMGESLGGLAESFRAWTESASGQQSIRQYFEDAMPVVRELGLLIGDVFKMFGDLARQSDLAPLIGQIRTELLPALNEMLTGVTGALGPAVVDLAVAWAQFQSAFSFQPFERVAAVLGDLLHGATDLIHSVPGLGTFVATLMSMVLVFKLLAIAGKMTGITMFVTSMVSKTGSVRVFTQALMGNTAALAANQTAQTGAATAGAGLRTELGKMRTITQMVSAQHGRMAGAMAGARQGMTAMKGAASGLVGFLGGPWGIAMMAAAALVMIFVSRSQKQKQRIDEITTSLNQQTGALTANTRATVAKQLEDDGILKKARELGISINDVTSAAMGNKDAFEDVVGQLSVYEKDAADAAKGNSFFSLSMDGNAQSAIDVARAIRTGNETITEAQAKQRRLAEATAKSKSAMAGMVPTVSRLGKVEDQLGRSAEGTATKTAQQKAATDRLRNSLLRLHNQTLKNMGGDIGFQQSLDDLSKEMRKGKRTLDIHTQAGRDNASAMLDLATSAGQVGGSAKHQQAALRTARNEIIHWAKKAGMGKDAAKAYADKLISLNNQVDNLPKNKSTNVDVTGIDYAKQRLRELDTQLYQMTSTARIIHVETRLDRARRYGGPVDTMAPYTVGEAGPELYQSAITGRVEVIGRAGQEKRTFREPGVVLPNEFYEAAAGRFPDRADAALPQAAGPARTTTSDSGGGGSTTAVLEVPDVHLHFHGDGSALTPDDVKRAAKAAWLEYDRERKERR